MPAAVPAVLGVAGAGFSIYGASEEHKAQKSANAANAQAQAEALAKYPGIYQFLSEQQQKTQVAAQGAVGSTAQAVKDTRQGFKRARGLAAGLGAAERSAIRRQGAQQAKEVRARNLARGLSGSLQDASERQQQAFTGQTLAQSSAAERGQRALIEAQAGQAIGAARRSQGAAQLSLAQLLESYANRRTGVMLDEKETIRSVQHVAPKGNWASALGAGVTGLSGILKDL